MWGTYVGDDINIVLVGFEKHSQNWPRISQLWTVTIFFSKTVVKIRTKISTAFLHYVGKLCVQWHQNRMAGVWETLPKLTKKEQIVYFFYFFFKTCRNDSKDFFTAILHFMGDLYVQWHQHLKLGFNKQLKLTKEQPIVNILNFFKDSRHDSNEFFYSHSKAYWSPLENSVRFERNFLQPFSTMWGTYVCNVINIVWLGFEKPSQNWHRTSQFLTNSFFFQKLSKRLDRKLQQPFYTMSGTYVCNDTNIVLLGFEKHSQNWPRNSQLWTFSILSQTLDTFRTKFSTAILHYMGDLCVQWH